MTRQSSPLGDDLGRHTSGKHRPSPDDLRAYMHDGQVPADLIDPISHDVLRSPVRVHEGGLAYSRHHLVRWLATRGNDPVDLITGSRPVRGQALQATDLAERVDSLREAAEQSWSRQGDLARATATRWLRAHCRALEKRPLTLTVAGIALADAVRTSRLSKDAAERMHRSGRNPRQLLHLLTEAGCRAIVRQDQLTIVTAHGQVLTGDSAMWVRRGLQAAAAATLSLSIGIWAAHHHQPGAPILRVESGAVRAAAQLMTALTAAMVGATEMLSLASEGANRPFLAAYRCFWETVAFFSAGYMLSGPASGIALGVLPLLAGGLCVVGERVGRRQGQNRQLLAEAAAHEVVEAPLH